MHTRVLKRVSSARQALTEVLGDTGLVSELELTLREQKEDLSWEHQIDCYLAARFGDDGLIKLNYRLTYNLSHYRVHDHLRLIVVQLADLSDLANSEVPCQTVPTFFEKGRRFLHTQQALLREETAG